MASSPAPPLPLAEEMDGRIVLDESLLPPTSGFSPSAGEPISFFNPEPDPEAVDLDAEVGVPGD